MRTIILTSDKTMGALPAFCHQWKKHYAESRDVLIGGFSPLSFDLPVGFSYVSLGDFADYPYHKWSNALITLLESIDDEHVLWTMDDFWLLRKVDSYAIELLGAYMQRRPDVARIDLSTDRFYAPNTNDVEYLGRLDLVASHLPVPYLLSLQAGVWNRRHFLHYLRPNETAAETELIGSQRMNDERAIVYGTRQAPMRYLIAVQHGKVALDGGYQKPALLIPEAEISELRELGYLDFAMKDQ